jgi:hypothetical protein
MQSVDIRLTEMDYYNKNNSLRYNDNDSVNNSNGVNSKTK